MKHLALFAALGIIAGSQVAHAMPTVNIVDGYRGSDAHGHGDVIGDDNQFNIHSMDVQLNGSMLSVTINTAFAGRNDDGSFSSYTNTAYGQGQGIGYGDLFLSGSWDPFGSAPYASDDNSNGTQWTYGFSLGNDLGTDNRWDLGGTGSLYALNGASNDANALLSEDFMSGATYRNGQEVAVDTASNDTSDTGNTGTWTTGSGKVNFLIDLTGTSLLGSDIALHWGLTCANDVIEGEVDVPATGILMLLSTGLPLIGLAGLLRRHA